MTNQSLPHLISYNSFGMLFAKNNILKYLETKIEPYMVIRVTKIPQLEFVDENRTIMISENQNYTIKI